MNHITEFEVFERLAVIDLNQCRSSGFASAGVVFFSAFSKKPQMVKWGWVVYIVMIFDHMWWKLMIYDYITIYHCIWQENSTWTRIMVFQLQIFGGCGCLMKIPKKHYKNRLSGIWGIPRCTIPEFINQSPRLQRRTRTGVHGIHGSHVVRHRRRSRSLEDGKLGNGAQ